MDDAKDAVVIDNGSYMMKAGWSGNHDAPRGVFPSIYGELRNKSATTGFGQMDSYAGDEANSKRRHLNITRVIKDGIVQDWHKMDRIWEHTFRNELRVVPEAEVVLMSEKPWTPREDREKTAQILFENKGVLGLSLVSDAALALYASGRTTGVVVSMGYDGLAATTIYEGHTLPYTIARMQGFGGARACDYLLREVRTAGYFEVNAPADLDVVLDMMHKLAYVSQDYENDLIHADGTYEKAFELPSGNFIYAREQLFKCPEIFFKPHMCTDDPPPLNLISMIQQCIHSNIEELPPKIPEGDSYQFNRLPSEIIDKVRKSFPPPLSITKELYANIVLEGGASMFPGMSDRIYRELSAKVSTHRVKVVAPPERKYSVWYGGNILASLSSFQDSFVAKAEYDECGAQALQMKCLF